MRLAKHLACHGAVLQVGESEAELCGRIARLKFHQLKAQDTQTFSTSDHQNHQQDQMYHDLKHRPKHSTPDAEQSLTLHSVVVVIVLGLDGLNELQGILLHMRKAPA
jgi:hypothetical protein